MLFNNLKYLIIKLYKKIAYMAELSDWNALNKKFKHIGVNSYIPIPRRIYNPEFISIGSNFFALTNTRIEAITAYGGNTYKPEIFIGDNVAVMTDCHIGCINKVAIGNNVLIASRVFISDHSHGKIDVESLALPPNLRPLFSKGPVIIGNNVWIGEGVCILPNVTIGDNSIIGANSVVNTSVPANAVAVGMPAKVIRIIK